MLDLGLHSCSSLWLLLAVAALAFLRNTHTNTHINCVHLLTNISAAFGTCWALALALAVLSCNLSCCSPSCCS